MEGIKKNLLFVSQLMAEGNYVVFGPHDVRVYRDVKIVGMPILVGEKQESVYVISCEITYVEKTRKNETTDIWHEKLGHVNYKRLKVMKMKSMLKGLANHEV